MPSASPRRGTSGVAAWSLAAAVLLVLCLSAAPARAAGDPDLQWWTIETAHYRVHYERDLEPIAVRVARLAEDTRKRLSVLMGYAPDSFTEIVITDDTDFANGSATAVPYNTIRLFVTGPPDVSALGDYDDWYLDLLTHEQTHILHTDNISGVYGVLNAIIGKTFVPNQAQPRWVLEGLSIVAETSTTSAGRLRASLWDMMLRADVLDRRIADLDVFSNPARRWPQGTLWYLYGSYFTSWIAEIYGPDVWRAVAADYGASAIPFGINRAIRRVTGKTYLELFEGFKVSLERRYHQQMMRVAGRGFREGERLTFHGRKVMYPRFVPRRHRRGTSPYRIIYFRDDFHYRSGHYRLDLPTGSEATGPPPEELIAWSAREGPVAFAPDGTMLFTGLVPFERVYRRSDLFSIPPDTTAASGVEPHRQRLTVGLRATAPTVSATGRLVAFTVNDRGTRTLQVADRSPEGRLERRRKLTPMKRYEQAYTPEFSPDGSTVAFSRWTSGGYRDIWLVDVETGSARPVMHDRAMDLHPHWSADGSRLYFSSDRTGIYNIYEYTVATGELRQVTNVRTGALMPAVSEDGRVLVYVGYTSSGYDLYWMPLRRDRFLSALPPVEQQPAAPSEPPPTPMRRYRYRPWPTVRPHRWFFEYAPGNYDGNALTLTVDGADVVGHHNFAARVTVEPDAPAPRGSIDYTYGRLPIDFSLRLATGANPRTDYRFNDQNPEFDEYSFVVRSGISYADEQEFMSQRISAGHSVRVIDSQLPVGSVGPLDPYAEPTRDPFSGLMSTIHLGYTLSNMEGSFDTAGPARGFTLHVELDLADEAIGSQESVYASQFRLRGYLPMPWPGKHTLALSTAGAMSAGSYSRRGIYRVGGYDLENRSLLDTVMLSTVYDGGFTLRGYSPGSYSGSKYLLENVEYRIPLANPDIGLSTLPVYLRRVDGNLFLDYGGAFNELDFDEIELFHRGALIHSPQLHTSVGAELWLGMTFAYAVDVHFRLGYAYGFSEAADPAGQLYFLATNVF